MSAKPSSRTARNATRQRPALPALIGGAAASCGLTAERLLAILIGCYAAAIAAVPSMPLRIALAVPPLLAALALWTLAAPWRWIELFFVASLLLPPLPLAGADSGAHPALLLAALGLFAGLARRREWAPRGSMGRLTIGRRLTTCPTTLD